MWGWGATPQGTGADKAKEESTPGLRCRFLWARGRWSVDTWAPRFYSFGYDFFFNSAVANEYGVPAA